MKVGATNPDPLDNEAELVRRARHDPEAFGLLYERYVAQIYRYLYYRTGNPQDAEDLTARTFYRALEHLPRYQERGVPFSAWLYRIAHNIVVNWLRDRSRRPVVALEHVAAQSGPEGDPLQTLETQEERERLLQAFYSLPPERQELLILKFVEGMTNAQIGEILGRSEGAIKSLYHRTLLDLREKLEGIK
ncbi:MAG: sigma-70 family RNA polymerase sigma factor [Anaerolineae bacterium]|nr:sigma-70 family RNA polymerase sigma factor [Anaerolineae bacterium]MDW8069211.1 sigma-70 family RNA polymerase sigma factor [Anaerolineae bacterium]